MRIVEESGIEFDFTAAASVMRPDKEPSGGVWPNVDFRVDEGERELWIEVKSWHPSRFKTQSERIAKTKEFIGKLSSDELRKKLVAKFLGTSAYLAWTGVFVPKKVIYVMLLDSEPLRRDQAALLVSFKDRLKPRFPTTPPWTHSITHVVMDLETFQARFARYPCRRI